MRASEFAAAREAYLALASAFCKLEDVEPGVGRPLTREQSGAELRGARRGAERSP